MNRNAFKDMNKIYLDYAATTPTDPEAIRTMEPYLFEKFGNASSPHQFGREAQSALEESRETVARSLGAKPVEVLFNSGATEGTNHVIFQLARQLKKDEPHIILSSLEHHCVLEPVKYLKQMGCEVSYLPVDRSGRVDPEVIAHEITNQTFLIAVMHANNEIGMLEPIADIGRIAKKQHVPFLVDAAQTVGHIPVDVETLGADFLTLSAHKFYGPKGVGALYMRQGMDLKAFLFGGDQERNLRPSTQNVAGAVGMAQALRLCGEKMHEESLQQQNLRDRIIVETQKRIPDVRLNGHPTERLPNNVHFSFEGIKGEELLLSLDMAGFAVSTGSACTAGSIAPSHVLKAIGLSDELSLGSIRITCGRWTTEEEIDYFLEQLPGIVAKLRK